MMDVANIPVAKLLPHEAPMVLLDRVLGFDGSSLVAEIRIRRDSMFCTDVGVPGWIGIEYMAQAVAAHAGMEAWQRGKAPVIGYLLGTRAYRSEVDTFRIGARLMVHVEVLFVEHSLGAFACRIETDRTIASATINVYQPSEDQSEFVDSGNIS